jgi:DNA-binding NtrC family response regulator
MAAPARATASSCWPTAARSSSTRSATCRWRCRKKLLRALELREVEPLGSTRSVKVDVRVIATSSVDLRQMVAMGRFRSDLFFRLSVVPIELPPLRNRIDDLELLCDHILEEIAQRSGRPQREITATGPSRCSAAYSWPGQHPRARERPGAALALKFGPPTLSAEDFSLVLPRTRGASRTGERPTLRLADVVADAERSGHPLRARRGGGQEDPRRGAPGISRATLYEKLAALAGRYRPPTLKRFWTPGVGNPDSY